MNEEYLKGLHGSLGIEDDYSTWIEAVKDNDEYLQGLHGSIGVNDDYDTWKSAVFGEAEEETQTSKEDQTQEGAPVTEDGTASTSDDGSSDSLPEQEVELSPEDELRQSATSEGIINYFEDNKRDYPGWSFKKGVFGSETDGDVVAFNRVTGEKINVDVGNVDQIDSLLSKKAETDAGDWISVFGQQTLYDDSEIENLNQLFANTNYEFEKGWSGWSGLVSDQGGALVIKDKTTGKQIAYGTKNGLPILNKLLTSEDNESIMRMSDDIAKKALGDSNKEAKQTIADMSNDRLFNENLKDGIVTDNYVFAANELGMSKDGQDKMKEWLNKPLSEGAGQYRTETEGWRQQKLNDFSELKLILSPEDYQKALQVQQERSQESVEVMVDGKSVMMTPDRAQAEKLRIQKFEEYRSTFLEKKFKNNPLIGKIVQASQFDDEREYETKLESNKNREVEFKKELENFKTNTKKEQETLVANAKRDGVYSIDYDESSRTYTVEASDPAIARNYESQLNRLQSKIQERENEFTSLAQDIEIQRGSLFRSADKMNLLKGAGGKDYSSNMLISDVGGGFIDIGLNTQILFGSEKALEKKNKRSEEIAQRYKTPMSWDVAADTGQKSEYGTRAVTQNAAPIITAIGVNAIPGIGQGLSSSIVAGTFAISSAGEKRAQIENMEDAAQAAELSLQKLESAFKNGTVDKAQYEESKMQLMKVVADHENLSETEKWSLIIGTGLIEGVVTKYIGKVPNSRAFLKNIKFPTNQTTSAVFRSNMEATGNFLWQTGKGMVGEQLEEGLIFAGSEALDAEIMDRDFDWGGLKETAMQTLFASGPMNTSGNAYSTIMTQMKTSQARQAYGDIVSSLDDIEASLKTLDRNNPADVERREILLDARRDLQQKQLALTDEMEVDAILTGPKKMGNVIKYGTAMDQMDAQAGVDPTLSPSMQEQQRQEYADSLPADEKKAFLDRYNDLKKGKKKAFDKAAMSYENAANRMYGVTGDQILQDLIDNGTVDKNADDKTKAIAVHKEFKARSDQRAIGRGRSDQAVVDHVEKQIYGEGGFKNAKTKDGKPRKRRNLKAENELYLQYGRFVAQQAGEAVIISDQENRSAAKLLKNKKLEDLKLTVAQNDGELQESILQAYDEQLKNAFDEIDRDQKVPAEDKQGFKDAIRAKYDAEAEAMVTELRSGETNAFITPDGKYIVKDAQAAQAEMADGNLLAGTAISHEISHAIDHKAFTPDGLTNYGKNLLDYTANNHSNIHQEAMFRMNSIGLYNPGVDMDSQSNLFYDEYTKSVQDIFRRPSRKADRRKLAGNKQTAANFVKGLFGKDYKINTPRDAARYLSGFIDAFESGNLGSLQERKIKAKERADKKESLPLQTRRSANSPILHGEADNTGKAANALFENRDNNPDYIFDIANLYDPMIIKWLESMERRGWNLGQGSLRADNINDVTMNVKLSPRGLLGLIQKYTDTYPVMVDVTDPKTGQIVQEPNTISKFLNGVLSERLKEKFVLEGTTINPGNIKVDLGNAAELVSTEKADKLTDAITQEASNQFDTPLLDQFNFTQEMLDGFRSAVAKAVGIKLPALDAKQGKNQSISPLIRALKKEFGVKNGPLHNIVKQLMGKTKAEVEAFLTDPGNKKAILDAMTTTWLASNLPKAVEKKVRGITTNDGYTTDHVGRKKGTKPGDIEAWNASEDGPYKGMTDGKQKIRRNKNAIKDVANSEMLSKFAKGQTMTDMNRAGLTKLQLALAQELGLEMFKADMLNDGELAEIFKGRQELFDRVLADNFVEEFVRQSERGITKRSANPNIARAVHQEILNSYINNKGDKAAFTEDMKQRGIPQSSWIDFDFDALDNLMSDNMPAGYKNPIKQYAEGKDVSDNVKSIVQEAMDMGAFNQKETELGDAARVKMSTELGKLVDELPLAVFLSPVVKDTFFGFMGSSRGFDVSKLDQKDYSPKAKKAMLDLKNKIDKKIEEALSKKDEILSDFVGTYGFNPEDTRLFNAGAGLMGKVEKQILNSNETKAEKTRLHEERFGKEHRAANIANPLMLELVNNTFLDLAKNDRGAAVGWVYWNSMNTNNTSGPRSLSTWMLTQYEDGPQGLYKGVDVKTGELRFFKTRAEAEKAANVVDVEINKDNPIYNQAYAEAEKKAIKLVNQGALEGVFMEDEIELIMFGGTGQAINMGAKKGSIKQIDWGTGSLRLKGEHVTASATTSAEIVIAGLKALDTGNFDQAKSDIKKLTQEFDQALGAKVLSDIQDEALGTTSRIGYARIVSVLDANPAIYTDIDTFRTLDGETATDLAVNQFADREAIDAVDKIRKALSPLTEQEAKDVKTMDKTVQLARIMRSANPRGMSAFDFDETLIDEGENFITATKDGETKKISSGQWPLQGPKLAADGWSFDFSDFVNVRGGVEGPLFTKFKERLAKFGPENMFILTARPAEAATAIHGWLKSKGVEIPLENITGLGNSTGEAKALWMLKKFEQGYNDMYFVDDALPNVAAVKNILDQLDIKSDVQIAKRSANPKQDLNVMLERSKGVDRNETFNRVQARNKGRGNRIRQLFIPPSADDFEGLMYYNMGKGEQGNADANFFKRMFYDPYNRADRELDMYKQTVKEDIKAINKQFPDVRKKLNKDFAGTGYTSEQAMRIYLYDKNGHSVPGISEAEQKRIAEAVAKDYKLVSYATLMQGALKMDAYLEPKIGWNASSFNGDFADAASIKRSEYLQEWEENIDAVFDEDMLNKLEATHGTGYRSALEDSIARMKSGTNRPTIKDKKVNGFLDWLNGSVGAIMFFNARSAVLQTLSTVNFINFEDNNVFAAAKAFGNQKQYWTDFVFLFNSPMLKQRRGGLQSDLNASELQRLAEQGGVKAVIGRLLQFGFTPTQIADSFAIAAGGSTFYRNRVNKYLKLGFDQQTAETRAFEDFQEIAEATQQSSRPDKISQEQASVLGRLILAFQNTPMQYNRLIKKAALDLINGRGDWRSNVSRIMYYGAIQNIIFSSLQTALFAVMFDDEEEDEEFLDKKIDRIGNSTLDSLLRGSGIHGAVLATVKNTIMRFMSEREKGMRADHGRTLVEALNVSPPLGSKARKMYSAMTTDKWDKDIYDKIPLYNIDNPIWDAAGNTVEAVTNFPAGRMQRKISNLKAASDNQNATWQRLALFLGWDKWGLGVEEAEEIKEAEEEAKEEKKQDKKKKESELKQEKEKDYLKDQKKEKEEGKKPRCAAATRDGSRCKGTPVDGTYCTIHTKTEKRSDGKEVQCKKVKSDGNRCKMQTSNKSGLCYYHD